MFASGGGSSSTDSLPDGYIMDLESGWGLCWIPATSATVIEIGCMPLRGDKQGLNIIVDIDWENVVEKNDKKYISLEEYIVNGMLCHPTEMKKHMSTIYFGEPGKEWGELQTAITDSRTAWIELGFADEQLSKTVPGKMASLEKVELFQENQKSTSQPAIVPRKAAFLAFMEYCGAGDTTPPVWYAHNGNGFDYQVMECESKRLFPDEPTKQIAVRMDSRCKNKFFDNKRFQYRNKIPFESVSASGFQFIGYDTMAIFENFTYGDRIINGQSFNYDANGVIPNKRDKIIKRNGTQENLAAGAGISYGGKGAHTALSDCDVLRQLLIEYEPEFGASVVKRFPERKETIVIRPLFF